MTAKLEKVQPTDPSESTIARTVGVEIECITPGSQAQYNMGGIGYVEVVGDGSIDGDGYGFEVRVGPLAGKEVEDTLQVVCERLQAEEAFTNNSTGLHVHAHAPELSLKSFIRRFAPLAEGMALANTEILKPDEVVLYMPLALLTNSGVELARREVLETIETQELVKVIGSLGVGRAPRQFIAASCRQNHDGVFIMPSSIQTQFKTYAVKIDEAYGHKERLAHAMRFFSAVDPIIRSLVPSSRRHNTFCQPFEKQVRSGGVTPGSSREILEGIRERYCGINMLSLDKHSTIECRYHGGTVNADKIIHWARLWERCVDVAMSYNANTEADALSEVINGKNRLDMLLALLGLPESTCEYMRGRHTAFTGSDARHALNYIKRKAARRAQISARSIDPDVN